MRTLVWFRSDLRIRDNTAFARAAAAADRGVVAAFAICPDQWREHDWGAMKVDFVLRNVAALSDALADRNIALRIIRTNAFAGVSAKLLELVKNAGCDALYFNREYEVNERRRDDFRSSRDTRRCRTRERVTRARLPRP